VPPLRDHYDEGDLAAILYGAQPSTPDEVSVTKDGRPLDSAEAVIAFFERIAAGSDTPVPLAHGGADHTTRSIARTAAAFHRRLPRPI
jgi:hypothetical protein